MTIDADGRGLSARLLDPTSNGRDFDITLDLKRPLAPGWIGCFRRALAAAAKRQGATQVPEPLQHWMSLSIRLALERYVAVEGLRHAALEFLAPEPLARSLANRVFGRQAPASGFNWVCERTAADGMPKPRR